MKNTTWPMIWVLLVTLGATARGDPPQPAAPADRPDSLLVDERYRTACGPIASYVALRNAGRSATLSQLIDACGWREGKMTPFSKLAEVLGRQAGVQVRAARLSPEDLGRWFEQGGRRAAILSVRKFEDSPDHTLCVVGVSDRFLQIVDYPELRYEVTPEQISDVWAGEALLVAERRPTIAISLVWATLPGLSAGLLGAYVLRRAARPAASSAAGLGLRTGEVAP